MNNKARAESLRAAHHDVLYVFAGITVGCHSLRGPRGVLRDGEVVDRSLFMRFERGERTGWQWAAFSAEGHVLQVLEFPDTMEGFYGTPWGALWCLRECVAGYFHDVRSHRGH